MLAMTFNVRCGKSQQVKLRNKTVKAWNCLIHDRHRVQSDMKKETWISRILRINRQKLKVTQVIKSVPFEINISQEQ